MEKEKEELFSVRITQDGLTAYLKVSPEKAETFTVKQLEDVLAQNHVVYGIDYEMLKSIVEEKRYFIEHEVAKGIPPTDGKDGYFEYLFETNVDVKPKILKDGSVDYKSMGEIPVVEENQELVRYYPCTPPVSGKNVYGDEIVGKKGKDLQVLKGKGFHLSEDKTLYTAAVTGKATIEGNVLKVSSVLVVNQDVSTSSGGLHFAGDIVIKGNVLSGAEVRANGNIEVSGNVEAAYLVAGKSVILKSGMQGNGKGRLSAGKDVSGKFFEQVTIEAKGNVSANALMNCNVTCGDSINIAGKYGIIVGGNVHALHEIEATLLGNMAQTKTNLEVGTGENLYAKLGDIEEKNQELQNGLAKLKNALDKITQVMGAQPDRSDIKYDRMLIMRGKIEKEAELSELNKQKNELLEKMALAANARIIVLKSIYPGVTLKVNGCTRRIVSENYNVTYQKQGTEIEVISNI